MQLNKLNNKKNKLILQNYKLDNNYIKIIFLMLYNFMIFIIEII